MLTEVINIIRNTIMKLIKSDFLNLVFKTFSIDYVLEFNQRLLKS